MKGTFETDLIKHWPDGSMRIGDTRLLLDMVVYAFNEGATPEEIVFRFPSLTLPAAYVAVAYYLYHREEVDAYLHAREEAGERLREQIESQPGHREFRDRILARAKAKGLR